MPKSEHTPGPWFAFARGTTVAVGTARSGRAIDKVVHWSGFDACGVELAEQKANAKLIAAAPEMLRVLTKLCELNASGRVMARSWGDAEAILSKATS